MKNKFILLAALLLVLPVRGCKKEILAPSVIEFDCRSSSTERKLPNLPNIRMLADRCEDYVFNIEKLSEAIHIFAQEYSQDFDIDRSVVLSRLTGLRITVSAIPRTVDAAYDINGKYLKNKVPVNGLAIDKDNIWIEVRTSNISSTALIHELVHIMIWRDQIYHGDPDHEGKEFSGWSKRHTEVIHRVNNILLDLNI